MNPDQQSRFHFALLLLTGILFITMVLAVMLGPVTISSITVLKIILAKLPWLDLDLPPEWSQADEHIVYNIRLPRVLLGAIVGAGLAVVGVAIQALVGNALADPYILGVSSGASVAATVVILFGGLSFFGQYALTAGAFLGATMAMLLVYLLANVGGKFQITRLLLSGVAISIIFSAVTQLIVMMAPKEHQIRDVMFWMMGSLAGAKWEHLSIPGLVLLVGFAFLFLQQRALNALLMGEETAVTLGINLDRFRKTLIIVLSLLTGTIVSVSGSIGFIGLMIPHISRFLVGSDHRRVLPVSMLLGAVVVIIADVFARLVMAPEELPIGIVTALCGGPFFIWLLRRNRYTFGGRDK